MSARIMPVSLREQVERLTLVNFREVEVGDGWRVLEVLPVNRNAHMHRYLAQNPAPRLRLVTIKKFGKTWLYFQPIKET